jgi:hypothetical protein
MGARRHTGSLSISLSRASTQVKCLSLGLVVLWVGAALPPLGFQTSNRP